MSTAYDVFLHRRCIDTVFHTRNKGQSHKDACEELHRSLVNHDGYNPSIKVRKAYARKATP